MVLVAQAGPPSTSRWSGAPVRGKGRDCAQLRLFETHSTRHCTMQCTTHKIYTADRMRFSISYTRLITRLTKLTTRLNSQARLSLPLHHLLQLLRQQRFYLQTLAFLLFMPHDFQDLRILKSLGFEDHYIPRMLGS